jgi:hypothetical protein
LDEADALYLNKNVAQALNTGAWFGLGKTLKV